jgi:hypothetical protein
VPVDLAMTVIDSVGPGMAMASTISGLMPAIINRPRPDYEPGTNCAGSGHAHGGDEHGKDPPGSGRDWAR